MVKIELETRHLSDVSDRGFVLTFKHWMGRLFSNCAHLSLHLYQLIHKINDTSKPIIDETKKEKSQTPPKERKLTLQTPPSDKDKIIPLRPSYVDKGTQVSPSASPLNKEKGSSPLSKEKIPPLSPKDKVPPSSPKDKKNKDDILDLDETPSILSSLFAENGLKLVDGKLPKTEEIYDFNGKRQEGKNLEDLSGTFHIEWPTANLIYRGHLQNGKPHGKGSFEIPEEDGSVCPILDGEFKNGAFTSGLLVQHDDSYSIEGTFVNGKMNGEGTIYYFPEDEDSLAFEYRGSFLEGKPHGKGKLYLVSSEMKLKADGEFVKGEIANGRMWKGKRRYEGKFDVPADTFEGKVYIHNEERTDHYEGQCQYKSGNFQGRGKLSSVQSYTLNEDEDDEEEIEAPTVEIGEFRDDKFVEGKREIRWSGRSEILTIKNSKVVKNETVIKTDEGFTYIGEFTLGTIDGEGSIYNDNEEKIYRGEIKSGVAHGDGEIFNPNDNQWHKGTFDEGNFVNEEDSEEE